MATATESKAPPVELGHFKRKLEQIDKKLKSSEEDREELKREVRYNKNKNLDNYFTMAIGNEEKLLQMTVRVNQTDKKREKLIKKDVEEMKKKQYETVNDKLWSLETRMDTMSRHQAENSYAIQSKLDALLKNSINQDEAIAEKTRKQPGTRMDFAEAHRKIQESIPLLEIHTIIGLQPVKSATKNERRSQAKGEAANRGKPSRNPKNLKLIRTVA